MRQLECTMYHQQLLKDRISGSVKHGTKPGPKKYLNDDEEEELAVIDVSAMENPEKMW